MFNTEINLNNLFIFHSQSKKNRTTSLYHRGGDPNRFVGL
jgi:hypothetical protein